MSKRTIRSLLAILLVISFFIIPGRALAYGPSTMYVPPSYAPKPGSLYARAMQTSDGTMYATFEQYAKGASVFPIYRSSDLGRSWTQVGQVKDTHKGVGMRWQPHLYELPEAMGSMPAGTLLCAGNAVPEDRSSTELELYKSNDKGRTWTFVSSIAYGPGGWPGQDPVWEPCLLVVNHKLICYYSDERDPKHSQKLVHQTTTDGVTWGPVIDDVALTDSGMRPGMPVVAQMENGKYIMTYEVMGDNGGSFYQISADGEHWNVTSTGTRFSNVANPYCCVLGNTVLLSCAGTGDLYANTNNGVGNWTQIRCPMGGSYSRCLVPLASGRLFIIGAGWNGDSLNPVTYADMEVPGAIVDPNRPTPTPIETKQLKEGWYYIKGAQSNKYMQVTNNRASAGENVEIGSKSNEDGQKWYLTNLSDGYITLKNGLGDFMLDVTRGENEDGTNIEIYDSKSHTPQQFTLQSADDNAFVIYTAASSQTKVLDVEGAKTEDGTNVCQWTYNGRSNQQWIFEPVSGQPTDTPTPTATPTEEPTPIVTTTPTITPTEEPTPIVTDTPTPTPTEPLETSPIEVATSGNGWSGGYNMNFTLSNVSTKTISNWKLTLKSSEVSIDSIWCASKSASGTDVTITPEGYNASILSGKSNTFGFGGSGEMPSVIHYEIAVEIDGVWVNYTGSCNTN